MSKVAGGFCLADRRHTHFYFWTLEQLEADDDGQLVELWRQQDDLGGGAIGTRRA